MKNGWEKSKRASADFGVDDTMMVQFNPDLRNYKCWSVGDRKNPCSGGGQLYGKAKVGRYLSLGGLIGSCVMGAIAIIYILIMVIAIVGSAASYY